MSLAYIEEWWTYLDIAIEEDDVDLIAHLLNDVSLNNEDANPLHFAVATGSIGIIRMIYKSIIRVRPMTIEEIARLLNSARCPFPYIVSLGNIALTETMLIYGADVNERIYQYTTALHICILDNDLKHVELLLKRGADVESRNEYGDTPLHVATHLEIIKLLVSKGGNVNAVNESGETPLHVAASNQNLKIVKYLVEEAGADLLARNHLSKTVLHFATMNSHSNVLEYIMDSSLDLNTIDALGATPLHHAAQHGQFEAVKLLLRRNVDCNLKDVDGNTPLKYMVTFKRCREVARLFFENGADVNGLNPDGTPSILRAALDGRKEWEKDIVAQIAKLDVLAIPVRDENLNMIEENRELKDYYENCKIELATMKELRLYSNISLFDLLVRKLGRISGYARNDELICSFNNTDSTRFPIYFSYTKDRVKEQVRKQKLIKSTEFVFSIMIDFASPCNLAVNKIISFLNEKDMLTLINMF